MSTRETTVTEIIAEISELVASARTNWMRAAEDAHPELRGLGLMMLHMISRKCPITATELGAMLDMDKAAVSRHITHLRELGLVDATASAEDRRVTLLTTTPAAHAMLEDVSRRSAENYHKRFSGWDEADLAHLQGLLHRFNGS